MHIFKWFVSTTVPGAPPQDVHGVPVDSRALRISWKPPPREKHHGKIVYYKVIYSEESKKSPKNVHEVNVTTNDNSVVLKNLNKWTVYRVSVLAGTKIGDGPASEPLLLRTDEDGTFLLIFNSCTTFLKNLNIIPLVVLLNSSMRENFAITLIRI